MNLDYEFIKEIFPDILTYVPVTLKLVIVALLISFLFGIMMALINQKKIRVLSQIVKLYMSLIRGTPVLLQIFVMYNIAPYAIKAFLDAIGSNFNIMAVDPIYYAYFALSLTTTVSIAEAVRAGLGTVSKGQYEAGLSVGMSGPQTFFSVVFPQALTTSMPVICNAVVDLIKSTSLAFMMSVVEVTGRAKILGGTQLRYFEAYITVFLVYIVLISVIEKLIRLLEKRMGKYRIGVHRTAL